MAIKPNDCVVKISDLVVGEEQTLDMFGRATTVPRYEQYWRNFCQHTDQLKAKVDWKKVPLNGRDVYAEIENQELAKYGATFKRTKQYKENYIKFKSHKHLTAFILRWS